MNMLEHIGAICFSTVFLLLSSCCSNKEFDVEKYIGGNPLRCASNLLCYEVIDSSVTPAPRGYEPFYISHIGRHGSRGHNGPSSYKSVDSLEKYSSLGYLTADGEQLLSDLREIRRHNIICGYGELTDKGEQEQRGIAARMGRNYPEVFSDPSRRAVRCFSTTVPRVKKSMDSFTSSLSAAYPNLEIISSTSKDSRFAKAQVNTSGFTGEQKQELDKVHLTPFRDSSYRAADWSRLIDKTFVNSEVPSSLRGNEGRMFEGCFTSGVIRHCYLSDTLKCIETYFTEEELFTFWKYLNARQMNEWGWTSENKGYRARSTMRILNNIIADANAVIAGADTCATLRFTHDSVVLPLLCLMGVRGCEWHGSFKQISAHSAMSYSLHMAGNLQLVFFRNRGGDILVKLLLNEQETVIEALKPDFKGVFYRWDRLKEYFTCLNKLS